jgi:hypothetical protein
MMAWATASTSFSSENTHDQDIVASFQEPTVSAAVPHGFVN